MTPGSLEWTDEALTRPHEQADKPARVRAMFAAIAGRYDLNNRVHSLGRDRAWRRFAADRAALGPADHALDVACGTGDLTLELARRGAARVVGLDFTAEMLAIARQKAAKRNTRPTDPSAVEFAEGDAMALPFPDASFDAVTIAFGIRNVAEPMRALREFFRVLRPGGRVVVLEFDRPRTALMRALTAGYCGWLMPRTATLISGDRSGAYRYLPRSVGTFADSREMLRMLGEAGFAHVQSRRLTLGVCACTWGVRE
ncbi:MAG: bifunctional demethylmenaquinone methyltransferase/2-methoxy-6-polyprenyl-1,4-benzoquinol methylase UbiE [Phycisphaerae bacterium]|nr:bifunctional demethylmenaquinone methyltransferase/2-methoxy-6-polyprenyl-1,4-benzoquinol methylase UbiE [Phycisphaerae bacterium]